MIQLLTEPAFWLVVTLAVIVKVWPRRSYYCRCHNVKLGTRQERKVHGESPARLRG